MATHFRANQVRLFVFSNLHQGLNVEFSSGKRCPWCRSSCSCAQADRTEKGCGLWRGVESSGQVPQRLQSFGLEAKHTLLPDKVTVLAVLPQ